MTCYAISALPHPLAGEGWGGGMNISANAPSRRASRVDLPRERGR